MSQEKSWQARIGEATDKLAQSFVESISYDRRLYKHDIAGSIAHATMLAKVGLITDAERDQIIDGLKSIERDIESDNFHFDESLEDIHMVIEAALIQRIGEPGKKLHTGRSRNDQVATDLILWCKDSSQHTRGQLRELNKALVAAAERNWTVVMPCFTHLQRAQPISAGAELLGWATAFSGCESRLQYLMGGEDSALHRTFPLGSGASAGSTLPLDRRVTQNILEFGSAPDDQELNETSSEWTRRIMGQLKDLPIPTVVPEAMQTLIAESSQPDWDRWGVAASNSLEATSSRDIACDFAYGLAMIAQWLSRWAEQWIIYSTTEFSFIKIADRYTTGSSMMPQKRNPDMLELIRGRCGTVYGNLFALLTILKGLPIGYNRDVQEDKRHVFQAYDTVSACLTMAAAIVSSASFVRENIEPTLERGFLDATSLAEYFVTKGVPFRTAHQIVGSLVARCEREGKTALGQLSVVDFAEALKAQNIPPDRVGQDVYEALGARNVVKRYRSAGAAGGEPFQKSLAEWKKRLGME